VAAVMVEISNEKILNKKKILSNFSIYFGIVGNEGNDGESSLLRECKLWNVAAWV
jgi:hypothetical protein